MYFDFEKNVLKNKVGITSQKELSEFEYKVTTFKLVELHKSCEIPKDMDISYLKEIHYYLFKDIYDWAGEYRVIDISKDGKPFMSRGHFEQGEDYLNSQISNYTTSDNLTEFEVCNKLSKVLIDINHFHPFREGNGRTQREFIRQLALLKGYELSITSYNEKYMLACIEDSYEMMFDSLCEEIKIIEDPVTRKDIEPDL